MSEEPMPKNQRILKGIVIILGVLIIAMVIIIIVASVIKYNGQKKQEADLVEKYQSNQVKTSIQGTPFELDIPLETGFAILSTHVSETAISLGIGQDDIIQKIILVDFSGKIIGTINLKNE